MRKYFIYFLVVITVASQISLFGFERYLMNILWIVAIGLGFHSKLSNTSKLFLLFVAIYHSYVLLNCHFIEIYNNYPLFSKVLIPPMIVVIASDLNSAAIKDSFRGILTSYFITTVVYCLWSMFFTSFSINTWDEASEYTFQYKNSFAQLASIGFLIGIYLCFTIKKRIIQTTIILFMLFVIISIFYAQSRTSIVALLFAVTIWMYEYSLKYQKKSFFFIFLILIGGLFLLYTYDSSTRDFINHSLLLDKYGASGSFDDLSSNRMTYNEEAINVIINYPWGIGMYYVDNLYLQLLTETGLIGFFLIFTLFVHQFLRILSFKGDNKIKILMMSFCCFYIIVSLAEAYPPFGPGVSSFMFWLTTTAMTKIETEEKPISFQQATVVTAQ